MDRRSFSLARRRRARSRTGIRAGRLPVPRRSRSSTHSRRAAPTTRDAADRLGDGSGPQAAGRGRDQGRRRRPGRRAGRRNGQAGRLHAAVAQQRHFRLRRGRQAVRPPAEDHARRLHPAGAADGRSGAAAGQRPAAVQDAEGIRRRREEEPGRASSTARAVFTARPICRSRSSRRRPASAKCAICRPMAAGRRSPPCSATTPRPARRRCRRRLQHIKSGKLRAAGLVRRNAHQGAARRADVQGAWLRRRILPVGRHLRAEGHAGRCRAQAERGDRPGRGTPRRSRPRSPISGQELRLSERGRTSRNSGTRMPSAPTTRCSRSAACKARPRTEHDALRADHVAGATFVGIRRCSSSR